MNSTDEAMAAYYEELQQRWAYEEYEMRQAMYEQQYYEDMELIMNNYEIY